MNATTTTTSHELLPNTQSAWTVRYGLALVVLFVLCVGFLNYMLVLCRKARSYYLRVFGSLPAPSTEPVQSPSEQRDNIVLNKLNPLFDPLACLERMRRSGQPVAVETYNDLLDAFVCTKRYDKAVDFFKLVKQAAKPDVVTYNTYLKGVVEAGKAGTITADAGDFVKKIGDEMKAAGIVPDIFTLNLVLELCVLLHDSKLEWDYFAHFHAEYALEPDLATFGIMLMGTKVCELGCANMDGLFEQIFEYLERTQASPPEDFVVLFIDVCIKRSDGKRIEKLLGYLDTHKPGLPLSCYGRLFTFYAQQKNPDKVAELHSQMLNESLQFNEITYGCLLEAYFHCGKFDKVTELYESNKNSAKLFNVIIYTTVIRAYAKTRQFDLVMDLYKQTLQENVVRLNVIAYNALIDCCIRCEKYDAMEKVLCDMIEEGKQREKEDPLVPDLITYSTIIKGLCKSDQMEKAVKLYEELKEKGTKLDEVVYNSLLDGCVKHEGHLDQAQKLISDMKAQGIPLSNYTYSILIKLYTKQRDIERALGVYEEMKVSKVVPGVVVYTCLLQVCIKNKMITKALEIFGEMKRSGVEADQVTYNTIINGCAYSGKLMQACEAMCESIARNVRLADDIYNNVLKNLITYRNMTHTQKHEYASKICNYIALNKIPANQEYYYQVLNSFVFAPAAGVQPTAAYAPGAQYQYAGGYQGAAYPAGGYYGYYVDPSNGGYAAYQWPDYYQQPQQ